MLYFYDRPTRNLKRRSSGKRVETIEALEIRTRAKTSGLDETAVAC